jgi:two-component system chemotaxis response regulator CheB
MSAHLIRPQPPSASALAPIRVMIVDDAVVVRGLLSRWMTEAGGIEIASTHRTGAEAVAAVEHIRPDVVLLDIEMPDMDGLTALPLILKKWPKAVVIIASTLTTRNAEISLRCLSLGAVDYVAKPSTNRDVTFSTDFRRDIIDKIRTLGRRRPPPPASRPTALTPAAASTATVEKYSLLPLSRAQTRLICVGASTGGPNAVLELLKSSRAALQKVPIVVVQHMPTMFTAMFAEHLRRQLAIDASEATHGEALEHGRVYVAPGGKHLRMERAASGVRVVIDDQPPVNFCKPSVDLAMHSAGLAYGPGVLGVMLTGMGTDGLKGAREIVERGGNILAQDEASSVVWGMPGAVVKKGLCAAVETVPELGRLLNRLAGGAP